MFMQWKNNWICFIEWLQNCELDYTDFRHECTYPTAFLHNSETDLI